MANDDIRETGEPKQTWGGERRQNHLYKPFLRGALVTTLTGAATLGALNLAVMGFGADLSAVWGPLIQAHGYAQMFGWVGLFIMGIAYHTLPRFYLRPLRQPGGVAPAFALAAAGLVLRFVAQPLASPTGWGAMWAWLVPVSAALGLAGVTLFVAAMYDTMRHGADRFGSVATGLFIGAGFAWLWLAAFFTVVVTVVLPAQGANMIAPVWDAPYLRATLSGAIGSVILGFTLRTMPHMLRPAPTQHAPDVRDIRRLYAVGGCAGSGASGLRTSACGRRLMDRAAGNDGRRGGTGRGRGLRRGGGPLQALGPARHTARPPQSVARALCPHGLCLADRLLRPESRLRRGLRGRARRRMRSSRSTTTR